MAIGSEPGTYLVGEYMGVDEWRRERAWTDRDGVEHRGRPADVRVLLGRRVVSVQYEDLAAAREAVAGAVERDLITLRVVYKSGVSNGRAWSFLTGWRSSGAESESDSV